MGGETQKIYEKNQRDRWEWEMLKSYTIARFIFVIKYLGKKKKDLDIVLV